MFVLLFRANKILHNYQLHRVGCISRTHITCRYPCLLIKRGPP